MAAPRPNEFTQHLARWVYQNSIPSVVLVTFKAKRAKAVQEHIEKMYQAEETNIVRKQKEPDRIELSKQERCATGFVVGGGPDHLHILTCAHGLDHVFESSKPIQASKIRNLFNTSILCDHVETSHRLGVSPRRMVPAFVSQIDCNMDLLLLRVTLADLTQCCQEPHPPLPLAPTFPASLDKVVVVSWPPYRPRTACVGETSYNGREYHEVFVDSPGAYGMRLSEVSVLTDGGSSGAPMLNGDVNVVGVLHGGAQSSLCYFISIEDVRATLTAWGVI